ncbi:MAG: hypothetical protein IT379_29660 [Deltaproteobacteria bacterium]|nr:hypothetical protein [Deltaproteobacteria bacterium]
MMHGRENVLRAVGVVVVLTTVCAAIGGSTARGQYPPGQYPPGQYPPGQPYGPGGTVYVVPAGPPQARARVVRRPTPALWITGISLLGAGYLAFLPVTSTELAAVVPVAGPWIVTAQMDCEDSDVEGLCAFARVLVVFDGLLQLTGAVLLTIGLIGRDVTVYDVARAEPPALRVTPWAMGEAAGLAVSGTL